ncbi:gamma carbonic anhydrase family protein [Saccharomonospora azurea]|uniref:Isoleucine patch superfamily enzyme, carbonic anhydrase/acetyltransferase n=1 Tax=Saccharomonospora azurea NA-128 TaxID=882081 RepID=H8G5Q5_9PSEU|nr:gamma carbonic anhydrase family protein [Saccharomonospora azurea]EHY89246.1 isoleucine patch superfamily enzyme, carbonic anhydrase/acetyltransferase [Saccharomonospora azurea NA-128]
MPLFSFEGVSPTVHPEAWIAPTATLVGDVVVEKGASVRYGAVLRGDFGRIVVREGANIQDNTVVHVNDGVCEIGPRATIGHSCIVHDCTIGEQALIGNGSVVLDKAVVGRRSLVAAGATVTPNTQVPEETIAKGSPAKDFTPLTATATAWVDHNAAVYRELARRHAEGVEEVQP